MLGDLSRSNLRSNTNSVTIRYHLSKTEVWCSGRDLNPRSPTLRRISSSLERPVCFRRNLTGLHHRSTHASTEHPDFKFFCDPPSLTRVLESHQIPLSNSSTSLQRPRHGLLKVHGYKIPREFLHPFFHPQRLPLPGRLANYEPNRLHCEPLLRALSLHERKPLALGRLLGREPSRS